MHVYVVWYVILEEGAGIPTIKGLPSYEEASVEECKRRAGKAPVSTKWVDIAKGDEVRPRWIARDFKPKGEKDRADLVAAMPRRDAEIRALEAWRNSRNRTLLHIALLHLGVQRGGVHDRLVQVAHHARQLLPVRLGLLLGA